LEPDPLFGGRPAGPDLGGLAKALGPTVAGFFAQRYDWTRMATWRRLVAAAIHRSPLEDAVTQDMNTLAEDYVRVWDVSAPAGIADGLYAPDVVDHNPLPGQGPGLDGIKQLVAVYHAVFPDLSVTTSGTHQGDQLGVPATASMSGLPASTFSASRTDGSSNAGVRRMGWR
jgi:SnoaL-like protein